MKVRKIVYLILGLILVVLDCFTTLLQAKELKRHFTSDEDDIGYLLGSQVFLYLGIWLLYRSYKVQQKIIQRDKQALLDAFDKIGDR